MSKIREIIPSPIQTQYRLKNQLEEILIVAEKVEEFAQANQLPAQIAFQINLCLEELITNTISYGYPDGGEHEIMVDMVLQEEVLIITIHDDGLAFNPLAHPEPDLNMNIADRPIGGLGIHLVRKMMDAIEYRHQAGKNVLVMKKWLQP